VVEKLQEGIEAALCGWEEYEAGLLANATLTDEECRYTALQTIAEIDNKNGREPIWFEDVAWHARLSEAQLRDAIEHWYDNDVLRPGLSNPETTDDFLQRFRLSPKGRDWARDGAPRKTGAPATSIHMHQHGANSIQQVGPGNLAHTQSVAISGLTEGIDAIRKFLPEYLEQERKEVEEHLAIAEAEPKGAGRAAVIKGALRAIQAVTIEGQKTFAPTITALVAGIVSGLT
jgi:hypothetical protein